jgi:molybdenum cofactor guanylyltransferase
MGRNDLCFSIGGTGDSTFTLNMANQAPLSRTGFLLVGGKSSRMGVDKAFLKFDGQTLLDRALGVLKTACGSVTIVGDPAVFAKSGSAIADVFPGCGPLAGIHAALAASAAELNAILAVDMPFVSAEVVSFLLAVAEDSGAIVTVPRTRAGFQPLCAVYRRDFTFTAEQALRAGNYKIDATFAGVRLRIVDEPELAAAGFSEKNFLNINTPEDRHAADLAAHS